MFLLQIEDIWPRELESTNELIPMSEYSEKLNRMLQMIRQKEDQSVPSLCV